MRANTLIVAALAVLFLVAVADSLRPGEEPAPSTEESARLAPCGEDDVGAGLELAGTEAVTLRLRARPGVRCRVDAVPVHLRIEDRAATVRYNVELDPLSGGVEGEAGLAVALPLPAAVDCGDGGPYVAAAQAGTHEALHTLPGRVVSCSSDEDAVTRRRASYVERAVRLCTAATAQFERDTVGLLPPDGLRDVVRWNAAAAEASQRTLRRLDAVDKPTRRDAALDALFALMADEIELLRETADGALVGSEAAAATSSRRRVATTERKDRLVSELAERWGVTTRGLHECPLRLPA